MEDDELYIEDLKLRNKQRYVNEMFEEEGLTDKVLSEQIIINKRRHELDLADKSEIVNDDFVQ